MYNTHFLFYYYLKLSPCSLSLATEQNVNERNRKKNTSHLEHIYLYFCYRLEQCLLLLFWNVNQLLYLFTFYQTLNNIFFILFYVIKTLAGFCQSYLLCFVVVVVMFCGKVNISEWPNISLDSSRELRASITIIFKLIYVFTNTRQHFSTRNLPHLNMMMMVYICIDVCKCINMWYIEY